MPPGTYGPYDSQSNVIPRTLCNESFPCVIWIVQDDVTLIIQVEMCHRLCVFPDITIIYFVHTSNSTHHNHCQTHLHKAIKTNRFALRISVSFTTFLLILLYIFAYVNIQFIIYIFSSIYLCFVREHSLLGPVFQFCPNSTLCFFSILSNDNVTKMVHVVECSNSTQGRNRTF